MLIGCAFLLLSVSGVVPASSLGPVLFGMLTWLAALAAFGAGLFFTSDSLSEEKREGTLGFLFLTDLRGYDVVGGKLLARSLRCFYGLLAIMPVLAITLVMGGVMGGQFWKTSLALLNALFCSLALGMFVSAISRDPQKAMAGTFLLLLVWMFSGTLADFFVSRAAGQKIIRWRLSSPFYAFISAREWRATAFWQAIGVTQVMSWVLLGIASLVLPRTWQERPTRRSVATTRWSYSWRFGRAGRRARLRRNLLGRNAVLWLACRERWQSFGLWALACLALMTVMTLLAFGISTGAWVAERSFSVVFTIALYLGVASQAGRFYVDARRSGLIELMLATPLTVREIVGGQWRALLRMFGPPALLVVAVDVLTQWLAGVPPSVSVTIAGAPSPAGFSRVATPAITTAASAVLWIANLAAICWFGMWMGMTSKNNNIAILKTIVFVQVIPWMGFGFVSAVVSSALLLPGILLPSQLGESLLAAFLRNWAPVIAMAVPFLLTFGKDLAFLFWARRRLYSSFREQAIRGAGAANFRTITPVPITSAPRLAAPPVIPAIGK
jgi:hypothetical protein